jgi:hypothetical protein
VSDRYERLVTVAAEVLAAPFWKHLSEVSVPDSSSNRADKFIVKRVLMTSRIAINFLELWRHPHTKLFADTYTNFD